ncbi:hypothetical protein JTE90_024304 [Oedothorax gibbosus]|uniref:Uncharacterized protein n=1 Tax=Oedothorax gibbosus TaxID=931172 RepID=A0AAV6W192_9ARAC|nr:hypothetical protein JTE90_024304 [Oedothorax gibbosus]
MVGYLCYRSIPGCLPSGFFLALLASSGTDNGPTVCSCLEWLEKIKPKSVLKGFGSIIVGNCIYGLLAGESFGLHEVQYCSLVINEI